MSEDLTPPEDQEASAGGADLRRLGDIEQRLKAARPRPAELDAGAILRSARAAGQPARLPEPSTQRHRIRTYGWMVTVACSWACGATAGALLTFVLLRGEAPPENSGIAALAEGSPRVAEPGEGDALGNDAERPLHDDSPLKNVPPWSASDLHVSLVLLDPYDCQAAPHGDARPMLGATDLTDTGSDGMERIRPGAAPARSMIRAQLLEELLGASPDTVL